MTTAVQPRPPLTPSPRELRPDLQERFVLTNVRWQTYTMLLEERGRRRYRITYDRGTLELMTLSLRHERIGELFARFVNILAEEFKRPVASGGSMTMRREDLERGLESDKCYYFAEEPLVRQREEIDLERDPPPDLGIEVDVSRSSINRLGIYAALRVGEIWRCDDLGLYFHILQANGTYSVSPTSRLFPNLSSADLAEWVERRSTVDESTLGSLFREWVRENLLPKSG